MPTYYLSSSVYACCTNGYVVFLDIETDTYTAIPSKNLTDLNFLTSQRKIHIDDSNDLSLNCGHFSETIQEILSSGVVKLKNQPSILPVDDIVNAKFDLSDANLDNKKYINFRLFSVFLICFSRAFLYCKFYSLKKILKLVHNEPILNGNMQKVNSLDELVYSFRRIRPLFYAGHDRCFFDCIVMMLYLKRFGFSPNWNFGVQMEPFQAHCWVQVGDTIVTDSLSRIVRLSTILNLK